MKNSRLKPVRAYATGVAAKANADNELALYVANSPALVNTAV